MRAGWLTVLLLAGALAWAWSQQAPQALQATPASQSATTHGSLRDPVSATPWPAFLPEEARVTLGHIERGGPFSHRQDGAVFQNRERRLPQQPRGYYHEYTVETPGAGDRGPRRIVSGGEPAVEYFYTDDHYRSFRRFTAGVEP
ncbi:MAG: ribonuclease domain-containing protein [Luteimonas sp.]